MKTISLKIALASCVALTAASVTQEAYAQSGFTLNKIPSSWTTGGKLFTNVEGYILDIADYNNVHVEAPNLETYYLSCWSMSDSADFYEEYNACNDGIRNYTCADLYQNSQHRPSRYADLVPALPVTAWAAVYDRDKPGKKAVSFNLGFFETDPFPNRSTNQNQFKPIYQEPCALNLGTYRPDAGNADFVSRYSNREVTNGVTDRPFGTLRFKGGGSGGLGRRTTQDMDSLIVAGDLGINGVWIRYNGTNTSTSTWPQFVIDKQNSAVGRTAIGIDPVTDKMRVVVIQPSRNAGNTGATIDDIRRFFLASTYPNVLLLDGSGSSQMAMNFNASTSLGATTTGRSSCDYTGVSECALYGDSVEKSFVDHYHPAFRQQDPNNAANYLIDRPVPNVMVVYEQ